MTPLYASYLIWLIWGLSWMAAALWSGRTAARPSPLAQAAHWIPTLMGFGLLFSRYAFRGAGRWGPAANRSWAFIPPVAWALTGVVLAGMVFSWWARLYLGTMWSDSVVIKEGHHVVDSGPYRLVRHPIYTGLLTSAYALAIQSATAPSLLGAALLTLGFTLKARLEERFLRQELGPDAYDAYRARTPMLIPFLKRPA